MKSTICRITRPDGWVVLNADDPLVARSRAGCGRGSRSSRSRATRSAVVRRHRARRRPRLPRPRRRSSSRPRAPVETSIVEVARVPITLGGLARHNVANALAAAGGARGLGATIDEVRDGLARLPAERRRVAGPAQHVPRRGAGRRSSTSPTTRPGSSAILDVAEGIAAGAAGRAAPITAIIGTAGDRPDDTLRGIGRIAAERAQRVAIKETLEYLRGRTRGVGRRRDAGGRRGAAAGPPATSRSTTPRPRPSGPS